MQKETSSKPYQVIKNQQKVHQIIKNDPKIRREFPSGGPEKPRPQFQQLNPKKGLILVDCKKRMQTHKLNNLVTYRIFFMAVRALKAASQAEFFETPTLELSKTFQKRKVSSAEPETTVVPSGEAAM